MRRNYTILLGLALLSMVSCAQNQAICADADGDGFFVDVTSQDFGDGAFECEAPLADEVDCYDSDATINPSVSEEDETDVDLNCNALINGSENASVALEVCSATTTVDTDADGITNECDTDDDDDGVEDAADNCQLTPNPAAAGQVQADADANGIGDVCEASEDSDGDGVGDDFDNCTGDVNPGQDDRDDDSFGDICDGDPDDPDVGMVIVALRAEDYLSQLTPQSREIGYATATMDFARTSDSIMVFESSSSSAWKVAHPKIAEQVGSVAEMLQPGNFNQTYEKVNPYSLFEPSAFNFQQQVLPNDDAEPNTSSRYQLLDPNQRIYNFSSP